MQWLWHSIRGFNGLLLLLLLLLLLCRQLS
jgi:hypothetical protein